MKRSKTKTQINQLGTDYIQNSETEKLEDDEFQCSPYFHSTKSKKKKAQTQRQDSQQRTLKNINYKRELLKLMIIMKLQTFGYQLPTLNSMIEFEMAKIQHFEQILAKDMDYYAQDTAFKVILIFTGEDPSKSSSQIGGKSLQKLGKITDSEVIKIHQKQDRQKEVESNPICKQSRIIHCKICENPSSQYCQEQCGHSFCLDCLRGCIREHRKNANYLIKCPQEECPNQLSPKSIQKVLAPQELQIFLHFKEKHFIQMNPENKFCSKPDCGEILSKAQDRLQCKKCQTTYCEICLQIFHQDKSCDIILKNAIQSNQNSLQIKKCPSCKSPIQKAEGCNHMTCKMCKCQFCWLCLKKYSKHHYKYYNCFGCPGMQFDYEEIVFVERLKQIFLYLLFPFIFSLILLCYIASLPIYMIGSFLYKPCYWSSNPQQFIEECIINNICCCLGDLLSKLLLWLIFLPRAAIYALFYSPVKLTMMYCGQICKAFE